LPETVAGAVAAAVGGKNPVASNSAVHIITPRVSLDLFITVPPR